MTHRVRDRYYSHRSSFCVEVANTLVAYHRMMFHEQTNNAFDPEAWTLTTRNACFGYASASRT